MRRLIEVTQQRHKTGVPWRVVVDLDSFEDVQVALKELGYMFTLDGEGGLRLQKVVVV